MARKRLQQKGDLYQQGNWWKLRWREDQRIADGTVKYAWSKPVAIGPSEGPGKLTEKQARRIAWDNFLSRLDQNMRTPQSVMTVAEFVERKFVPEHVAMLKRAGRDHYRTMLANVLDGIPQQRRSQKGIKRGQESLDIPRQHGLGTMRLRDVTYEDAQRLVSEAIQRGYATKTAKDIKFCVSAIFTHAEKKGWFSGRNPAFFVELPEMELRWQPKALSFEQLKDLLFRLRPLARTMVLCAALTSMNIAEICGLRWKRLNLSDVAVIVDGESIPAWHVAVREQWFRREFGSVKAKSRRRNLPLASLLAEAFAALKRNCKATGPDEVVFPGRNGRPLDAGAMLKRQVRPAGETIGVHNLGWHDIRRTFATLGDQLGMSIGERKALMGHSQAAMTLRYTHTPTEQAAAVLEQFSDKLKGPVN